MEMEARHKPVMVREVLAALNVRAGGAYIDCTAGEAGHSLSILGSVEPAPRLLGIDLDGEALVTANERLGLYGDRVKLVRGSYTDLPRHAAEHGFAGADGVLFDLGVSSLQLESAARGFSFSRTAKLDMRFDMTQRLTADQIVNHYGERELADIIYQFGEEPAARRIARAIVSARPIGSTTGLAETTARGAGGSRKRTVHPATRTFQALRIAVNGELDKIRDGLAQGIQVLRPGGRLVVLAYHSLEDRLVKGIMREASSDCICPPKTPQCVCGHVASISLIRRRVIKPSVEETSANPRSRSARLRVAERLQT